MGRAVTIPLLALVAAVVPLEAQTSSSTRCRREWNEVVCETEQRQPPRPNPGPFTAILKGLQESKERAQADAARRAQTDAALAVQQAALANAQALSDQRKAQWDAFLPRARMLIEEAADSLALYGRPYSDFYSAAGKQLFTLFTANPTASNAEIRDQLEPLRREWSQKLGRFYRAVYAEAFAAADSLAIPEGRQMAFVELLEPVVDSLYQESIEQTPAWVRMRYNERLRADSSAWRAMRATGVRPLRKKTAAARPR